MAKSQKILLYVEGKSEMIFIQQYFKKYIKEKVGIDIESQEGDIPTFKRYVQRGLYSDYREIFVLRDLKTEKKGDVNYSCITNMKCDFTTNKGKKFIGRIEKDYQFIVVCNDIESWILTFKKNTNNRNEKHIKEIYKEIDCNNKIKCMQKIVQKLNRKELSLDIENNKSFKYFMDKLEQCK